MGAVITRPMTIEEFDKLDLPNDREWELHCGELAEMSFPDLVHKHLQHRLFQIFMRLFPRHDVLTEYPFEVAASNDKRSADVAVVEGERAKRALQNRILEGTPELVVEVVSPSNSAEDLLEYRLLCLANQTLAFWVVYSKNNSIEVFHKDQQWASYGINDSIPISLLGVEASIPVRDIFAGITL